MRTYLQALIEYIEEGKPINDSETRIWYKAMTLRKAEEIEEKLQSLFKYKLITDKTEFYENSFSSLVWAVIKYKYYSLFK